MLKRTVLIVLMAIFAVLLTACGGRTTGAPPETVTDTTARVHYEGHCDPGDNGVYFVEFRRVGSSDWLDGPTHTMPPQCATERVPSSGEAPLFDDLTGLVPDSQYHYRVTYAPQGGDAHWVDSEGEVDGTNYHGFFTDPAPTGGTNTGENFWLNDAEIAALPTTGTAYSNTLAAANAWGGATPNLSNQDDNNDVRMLAAAIIGKRNNNSTLLTQVRTACNNVQGTEDGGRVLALARNLTSVVAACGIADVNRSGGIFGGWLDQVRHETMTECGTLVECSERRPNNWGTMSMAARFAASSYLGDTADLNDAWAQWQNFLGAANGGYDFTSPAETYSCLGALSNLRGIEPPGCTKSGVNLDGAVPDDARRCGAFTSPPCVSEPYDYEGRQGIIVATVIAQRAGFGAKTAQSSAVQRSYKYLQRLNRAPAGDDRFQSWLERDCYGSASFTPDANATHGKNMGWTAWTHAAGTKCA